MDRNHSFTFCLNVRIKKKYLPIVLFKHCITFNFFIAFRKVDPGRIFYRFREFMSDLIPAGCHYDVNIVELQWCVNKVIYQANCQTFFGSSFSRQYLLLFFVLWLETEYILVLDYWSDKTSNLKMKLGHWKLVLSIFHYFLD